MVHRERKNTGKLHCTFNKTNQVNKKNMDVQLSCAFEKKKVNKKSILQFVPDTRQL